MYDSNIIKENVKEKWESVLNEDILYGTIEKTFKVLPKWGEGAYVKYFHFKLLHNRTITNKRLFNMQLSDTSQCSNDMESIKHAFLECKYVTNLWKQVQNWLKRNISTTCKPSDT